MADAARAAGIPSSRIYSLKARDADFAAALDAAQEDAYDIMEAEARRRAFVGHNEPVVYKGELQFYTNPDTGQLEPLTVKKYSDRLAQFLLAGYRKRFATSRVENTGADGAPIAITAVEREARIAAIIEQAAERKALSHDASDLC